VILALALLFLHYKKKLRNSFKQKKIYKNPLNATKKVSFNLFGVGTIDKRRRLKTSQNYAKEKFWKEDITNSDENENTTSTVITNSHEGILDDNQRVNALRNPLRNSGNIPINKEARLKYRHSDNIPIDLGDSPTAESPIYYEMLEKERKYIALVPVFDKDIRTLRKSLYDGNIPGIIYDDVNLVVNLVHEFGLNLSKPFWHALYMLQPTQLMSLRSRRRIMKLYISMLDYKTNPKRGPILEKLRAASKEIDSYLYQLRPDIINILYSYLYL